MLKYEFFSHLIVSLIYLSIISIFNIRGFSGFDYLMLWLGGLVGTYFVDIDHVIYSLVTRPNQPSSQRFQQQLKEKKYRLALKTLAESHFEHQELSFHNAIFIPIWIVFCFFILTSGESIFTASLVMTIYLHLLKDIWDIIRIQKSYDLAFLFWQIRKPIEIKIKKYFVWGITAIFVLETLFFLRA